VQYGSDILLKANKYRQDKTKWEYKKQISGSRYMQILNVPGASKRNSRKREHCLCRQREKNSKQSNKYKNKKERKENKIKTYV
jgi:hypothetical protein